MRALLSIFLFFLVGCGGLPTPKYKGEIEPIKQASRARWDSKYENRDGQSVKANRLAEVARARIEESRSIREQCDKNPGGCELVTQEDLDNIKKQEQNRECNFSGKTAKECDSYL